MLKAKLLLASLFVLLASATMAANLKTFSKDSAVDLSSSVLLYGMLGVKIKQIRNEASSLSLSAKAMPAAKVVTKNSPQS